MPLKPYSYGNQLRVVFLVELAILAALGIGAFFFWSSICSDSLKSCVDPGQRLAPATFLLLSLLRPLVFTPHWFVTAIAGQSFGPVIGTVWSVVGSMLSTLLVMGAGRVIGKRLVRPWLSSNLPATWKFLRSQDYKIAFAARLIPILPFDLVSLLCGVLDFRLRRVVIMTMIGCIPEVYVIAAIANPSQPLKESAIDGIMIFGAAVILPLILLEFMSRKKGASLWGRAKAMYKEINDEITTNNQIVKKHQIDGTKTPVLLIYGFFSTRRALTILERHLNARGYQVLSFNLGGVLGTFFTKSILDTAGFIDYKLKRQFDRHGFDKVHVVAHSKGGLVALWWLLRLGGWKHCNKVITMGTPFAGTRWTYLALMTPLGFFWRDMWQMRPKSSFLKHLRQSTIPENVRIYCLHSKNDGIATGERGVFWPFEHSDRVIPISLHHVSHFEFLYRRDVADVLSTILGRDEEADAKARLPRCELPEKKAL